MRPDHIYAIRRQLLMNFKQGKVDQNGAIEGSPGQLHGV